MKKILSVFLAVLMLFGALSISSSAASTAITAPGLQQAIDKIEATYGKGSMYNEKTNNDGYVVVSYSIGVGEFMEDVYAYDVATDKIVLTTTPGDPYYQIPSNPDENYITYGGYKLPYVRDTEEKQFIQWICSGNQQTYPAGKVITLSEDMISGTSNCIYFTAEYLTVTPQSDVLETVINVLVKVFGSIIGFIFFGGDPDAGTKFMQDMIGGILEGV